MTLPISIMNRFAEALWRWRWVAAAIAGIVLLARGARLVTRGRGDLFNHLTFGERFANRQFIYENGLDIVYPPFWAMAHALPSLLPRPVAAGLIFVVGAAMAVLLLVILNRMSRRAMPLSPAQELAVIVIALVLASRFILADLTVGNANTALAALSWLGVYLWMRGRDWLGAAALGLAVALKLTSGLFIAYFLWKRQWKMAASSALFALALSVSPALWIGPHSFGEQAGFWIDGLVAAARQPDPSLGILGEESVQNNALKPSIVRFLMHLAPGHAGRADHWLYVDLLDLSSQTAKAIISLAMALLVIVPAWLFRRRVGERDAPVVLFECAAVSLILLLLSPVTWSGHLVWMIPAFHLLARHALSRGQLPGWMLAGVGAIVLLVLILNRGVIGREMTLVLDSYHVQAWCILFLLFITLALHRSWTNSDGAPSDDVA